jgi:hypothetical protein
MAKRDRSVDAWEAISALRAETDRTRFAEELCKHFAHKAGVVVGKAALLGLERQSDLEPFVDRLSPVMSAAFDRCMADPVKTDPGCSAKIGIVNLGVALHCLDADLYLRAVHHVQMEGSFGPPIDTAESLRAAAAYGLLNCRHADATYEIVKLLCEVDRRDPHRFPDSRRGAIRALGTVVSETSAALLRMTAHRFARDPDTLCEAFTSLNSIEAGRSFDFIHGFLDDEDVDVRDIAALALAEGKQPRACPKLLEHAKRNLSQNPQAIFTALAITRKPEAIEFLLERLGNGRDREATAALEALHLMRHDEATCRRVEQIVKVRGGAMVESFRNWKY